MARKTIFVSDFSNKEIVDEKQSATITVKAAISTACESGWRSKVL